MDAERSDYNVVQAQVDYTCTETTQPIDLPLAPEPPEGLPTDDEPCGTIEDLCARVQTLLYRTNWIISTIRWLQTQQSPNQWEVRETFPDLEGSGLLTVSGILGLRVTLTELPTAYGQVLANPIQLFDVGTISYGADGATLRTFPIAVHDQIVMGLDTAITEVRYYLMPGVVATIQSLGRETV